ncbi:hypothetical protein [Streptomyces aurantiacus]|uniref:hypothetical protein n=1 Tax=Streptomyces aurantiacus TaxID=47760 RepID=UPI000AECE5A0|nr:hypothetical protein [Streptomyces aurantiacus]
MPEPTPSPDPSGRGGGSRTEPGRPRRRVPLSLRVFAVLLSLAEHLGTAIGRAGRLVLAAAAPRFQGRGEPRDQPPRRRRQQSGQGDATQ